MQLINIRDWQNCNAATTRDAIDYRDLGGEGWYGIAIGPESDESIIEVDDVTLQAGRVLPFRRKHYSFKRVRPQDSNLAMIETLQLVLFESPEEIFAYARPTRVYSSTSEFALLADTKYGVMGAPFCGREQVKISIITPSTGGGAAPNFTYAVYGFAYHYAFRRVQKTSLHGEVNPTLIREPATVTAGSLNVAPGIWNYSFYIGGTGDDAEQWDAIVLYIQNNAGETHSYLVDMSVTGETGAP